MTYNRHYCYRIDFADGFVYFGVRSCSCDPADDTSYMGSPVTHVAKWLTDIPRVKTIVSEHETRELAEIAEGELILAFWAVSKPLSLNARIYGAGFNTRGKKHTDEARAKMSEARAGKKRKPFSAAARANMSKAKKGRKAKPLSAEHRAKIGAAKKGNKQKPFSAETRANMSKAKKGLPLSAEHCAKIGAASSGTRWYTNGTANVRLKQSAEIPEGFRPGRSNRDSKSEDKRGAK